MKILRVSATNFKLCEDDFTIDLMPIARKMSEDLEYELQEIAENLHTFNTIVFVGKNASGKTTAAQLMALVYDIFSTFRVTDTKSFLDFNEKDLELQVHFYHEENLYYYVTTIVKEQTYIKFVDQHLYSKQFFKSNVNEIFNLDTYSEVEIDGELPDDTSIIFKLLKKINITGLYFPCEDADDTIYSLIFNLYQKMSTKPQILDKVIKIFDEHIKSISMVLENKFLIEYSDSTKREVDSKALFNLLSSGTTKGIGLFSVVVVSLMYGFDLVVDEIENHFHRTLVENIISLYKDKNVNKHNATLICTTHYAEILDLFNRSDNMYITKYDKKIFLENVYEKYKGRQDLLKSNKFYQNVFGTQVNYEALMAFKKELMK